MYCFVPHGNWMQTCYGEWHRRGANLFTKFNAKYVSFVKNSSASGSFAFWPLTRGFTLEHHRNPIIDSRSPWVSPPISNRGTCGSFRRLWYYVWISPWNHCYYSRILYCPQGGAAYDTTYELVLETTDSISAKFNCILRYFGLPSHEIFKKGKLNCIKLLDFQTKLYAEYYCFGWSGRGLLAPPTASTIWLSYRPERHCLFNLLDNIL